MKGQWQSQLKAEPEKRARRIRRRVLLLMKGSFLVIILSAILSFFHEILVVG
jgi:hypothetical protein